MGENRPSDEESGTDADLMDVMERRLDSGWTPEEHSEREGETDWSEFAWGIIPCPHCETGFIMGVHDPDEQLDGTVPMATLVPPMDLEEEEVSE